MIPGAFKGSRTRFRFSLDVFSDDFLAYYCSSLTVGSFPVSTGFVKHTCFCRDVAFSDYGDHVQRFVSSDGGIFFASL